MKIITERINMAIGAKHFLTNLFPRYILLGRNELQEFKTFLIASELYTEGQKLKYRGLPILEVNEESFLEAVR